METRRFFVPHDQPAGPRGHNHFLMVMRHPQGARTIAHETVGGWGTMNDQIVELDAPGLQLILYAPQALANLDQGGNYGARFPDGCDLVDYVNRCRIAALATRFPQSPHLLHFSSTFDNNVIARASDHLILGLNIIGNCLCVRSGDDLFDWRQSCPDEQRVSLAAGNYS